LVNGINGKNKGESEQEREREKSDEVHEDVFNLEQLRYPQGVNFANAKKIPS
jgi:hypothetical protein